MNILDYIKGLRKGESAHRLEKESMRDPFLYEALEGFDSVEDDHMARIEGIRRQLYRRKINKNNSSHLVWRIAIAASIIFVALISKQLFFDVNNSGLQARTVVRLPIDIYVPDNFYKENIAIIAHKNTILTRSLNISVGKVEDADKNDVSDSNTEEIILSDTASINIFVPNE